MYLVLLGAPGAGKGTQAANLARELGLSHIASGDLFREVQRSGTELGNVLKSYMEKGLLVPDEITVRMILERLAAPDCKLGCILDGFPRTVTQASALDKALKQQGKGIDKAAYINVSTEELLRRLSGRWICRKCQTPYHQVFSPPKVAGKCDRCGGELYQRADDTEETVKKRVQVYMKETAPLIGYYKKQSKLVEVNGEQPVDKVTTELKKAIAG